MLDKGWASKDPKPKKLKALNPLKDRITLTTYTLTLAFLSPLTTGCHNSFRSFRSAALTPVSPSHLTLTPHPHKGVLALLQHHRLVKSDVKLRVLDNLAADLEAAVVDEPARLAV